MSQVKKQKKEHVPKKTSQKHETKRIERLKSRTPSYEDKSVIKRNFKRFFLDEAIRRTNTYLLQSTSSALNDWFNKNFAALTVVNANYMDKIIKKEKKRQK